MSPLSPVTTNHFLGDDFEALYREINIFYKNYNISSMHHLYLNDENLIKVYNKGHLKRINIQYKFFNKDFKNFEDYLASIKSKKKKQLIKERCFDKNLIIKQYTKDELTIEMAQSMFYFYKQTVNHKRSIPYLNEEYFKQIFKSLRNNLLYVEATFDNIPVAGSLFFYDDSNLYGRYWGAREDIKNLHFELCYYQGLDFCFKYNISVFESGAQGEHKIKRGFTPIEVNSCHHFKNTTFHNAISNYIDQETEMLKKSITELKKGLPFKSDQE
jgi:predicted N-acyltransferase